MKWALVVSLCCLICSGCATIVSDSSYPVQISSNPPGARVTVMSSRGQVFSGVTPTVANLKSGRGFFSPERYTVEFEKEGYFPANSYISCSLDPWYIGNIIFGGTIGLLIVDPLTGAMWKIATSNVSANLAKDGSYEKPEMTTARASPKLSEVSSAESICSHCGASVPATSKFCPKCGEPFVAKKLFCISCGAENSPESKFCSKCGKELVKR